MKRVIELRIDNFRECIKLSQRAVFVGLSVAALVQYLSAHYQGDVLPAIPLFSVEFTSLQSLQVALLILYIGAGLVACFSATRAFSILTSIDDPVIKAELARYPSIIATSIIYSAPLAGALLGSGMLLMMEMTPYDGFREFFLYVLVSSPFFVALQFGGRIYRIKNVVTSGSTMTPEDSSL
ncbi:hypothetical protein [Billgrantia antri]|uniref:hypothetical protein n=1 Tax=Billgrantia antri TaxID=2846777 RepID=UPI003B20E530